jgi:queuine tRNA-ribosyltransferase
MPVATAASVKSLTPKQVDELGAEILLSNTYHLMLRPGADRVAALGGLHRFMSWTKPVLTDSGGFQVASLSALRRVEDEGVTFRSHLDGSLHSLTPERADPGETGPTCQFSTMPAYLQRRPRRGVQPRLGRCAKKVRCGLT